MKNLIAFAFSAFLLSCAGAPKTEEKSFIDELAEKGGRPLYELTPAAARQVLADVQSGGKADAADTAAERTEIETVDGRKMTVEIVRPKEAKGALPVVFYIHGGGWVMGSDKTHERLIRTLAEESGAAVVFPVYENAPENGFPQMTEELFAVLKHVAENGGRCGLDAERLALAGDSVGGNMAMALALKAKAAGFVPKIRFMLLFYPVAVAAFETESYRDFADGPWLTKKAMEWFWDAYTTDPAARNGILASPLKASAEELRGLPPALVITAENDVLRDEGEELARRLDDAGVETASVRFNGTIHDFVMLNALADSASSQTALLLAAARLKQVLGG